MATWVDFKKIREQINFGTILRHYGVEIKAKGDQHHGFCPLPTHQGEKRSASFSANLSKGIFQCFGCQAKGNLIDFAAHMENLNPENGEDVRKAALLLQERFCVAPAGKTGKPKPAVPAVKELKEAEHKTGGPVVVNAPLDFALKQLDPKHPYLAGRGFSPETVAHFGLGYAPKGMLAGRIAIPLDNEKGELVGYCGRIVDDRAISADVPKYRFPSKREHGGTVFEFHKLKLLYNAHRLKTPVHDLVVVEGFPSVWWLWQNGMPTVVALMGAALGDTQAEIIGKLVAPGGRVWVMPDGNEAGIRCAKEALAALSPNYMVRWVRLPADKQPTDFRKEELGRLLPFEPVAETQPTLKLRFARKEMSKEAAIIELANSFPSLRAMRLEPQVWDPEILDRRAAVMSSGERHSIQFLLHVWNPMAKRECGTFDAIDAVKVWDKEHRQAFTAWALHPWWP